MQLHIYWMTEGPIESSEVFLHSYVAQSLYQKYHIVCTTTFM